MSSFAKAISALVFVFLIAAAAIYVIQHERQGALNMAAERVDDAIRDL